MIARGYLNIAISLLFIGVLVSIGIIVIDHIRTRRTEALDTDRAQKKPMDSFYKKFVLIIAIIGATIGALVDIVIGPYLASIRERLLDIHPYTPIIFSILFVLLFKKIIENIEQ